MKVKPAIFALLAVLALPGIARAGDVSMVVRDVPLGGRALASADVPARFNMVGLHWQGTGTVEFRAHRTGGGWGPWTAADADTGPDARSPEAAATRGWRDGNPVWTGASDRIAFRTHGTVTRLRAYYLWSPVTRAPARATASAAQPGIVSRFGWQANEQIVRARPQIAASIKVAIVHHTVNANTYTRAQAPALVRGIETYHVKGNGWNDIGYNFVIDRFGTIYEGRGGGIDKNVIGAHSLGFNTGSVGVALLGTYSRAAPTAAQQDALVQLLAWRLDVAHLDPLSFQRVTSLGNSRFRAGSPVNLRAISGHRDTYFTDCPGSNLYGRLPAIAAAVARTGLPKIYEPVAASAPPEAVRFTARLSSSKPWTVTVSDASGAVVGSGSGGGTKVDWTWSGVTKGRAPYRWTIEAPGARAASGTIGKGTPAGGLAGLTVSPSVLTDGATTTHVSFSLGQPSAVRVLVQDATGFPVLEALNTPLEAGAQQLDADLGVLPDGRYRLVVSAQPQGGKAVSAAADVTIDRTVSGLALSSGAISPNGDGARDGIRLSFSLAAPVPVRAEIRREGIPVATLSDGDRGAGPQAIDWDGRDGSGAPLPDGTYRLALTLVGGLGEVTILLPVTIDTVAPVLEPVDPSTLRFRLSEPATVNLVVNGQPVVKVEPAGVFHVPNPKAGVQTVTAQAADAAGNLSALLSGP